MFQQGFWFDVTVFVGLVALSAALVIMAISGTYLLLSRRLRGIDGDTGA
jgi:hypothetical protein